MKTANDNEARPKPLLKRAASVGEYLALVAIYAGACILAMFAVVDLLR